MEKSYNLLYIHELVNKHIQQEQKRLRDDFLDVKHIYHFLLTVKEPYGVTSQQKKLLQQFKQIFSSDLQKPKQEEESANVNIAITYKDYKEKIGSLALYMDRHQKILFYPMFLSQFEGIVKDYKATMSKPVIRNFSQRESLQSEEEKETQEYLCLMQDCFTKETVDSILQKAAPKEDKLKVVFEDNVSARARRYLDNSPIEVDEGYNDDDDDEGKSKIFSGIQYTDLSRVNVNQKYKYEKKCHFKDTVKQYQGLQNKNIPEQVIQDVIELIKRHGLYTEDPTQDPYVRLTKDHIRVFLDESDNARYYEDLQLIYSRITGKACPNISKYESKLYEDFDCLVDAFLSLNIRRKNFLNSHYVLRQLLKRQGHRVPDDDLTCLKTLSRVQSHDEIYQKCCEILKWNFQPSY